MPACGLAPILFNYIWGCRDDHSVSLSWIPGVGCVYVENWPVISVAVMESKLCFGDTKIFRITYW
jgi:hypothetical protein